MKLEQITHALYQLSQDLQKAFDTDCIKQAGKTLQNTIREIHPDIPEFQEKLKPCNGCPLPEACQSAGKCFRPIPDPYPDDGRFS